MKCGSGIIEWEAEIEGEGESERYGKSREGGKGKGKEKGGIETEEREGGSWMEWERGG